jgi:hypothetical protein
MEQLLKHFSREGEESFITGTNLHIVNGLERTDCGPEDNPIPDCPNGLGNLIVGYNEPRPEELGGNFRTGSHKGVVGIQHNFSRFGGIAVGVLHEISGDFAAVSGGDRNTASGMRSSVSGGLRNTASGVHSTVSGGGVDLTTGVGAGNTASGDLSSVTGGSGNTAAGTLSVVSSGLNRTAPGLFNAVAGGLFEDE